MRSMVTLEQFKVILLEGQTVQVLGSNVVTFICPPPRDDMSGRDGP